MRFHDRKNQPMRIRTGHWAYGGFRIIHRQYRYEVHRPNGVETYEDAVLYESPSLSDCRGWIDNTNKETGT